METPRRSFCAARYSRNLRPSRFSVAQFVRHEEVIAVPEERKRFDSTVIYRQSEGPLARAVALAKRCACSRYAAFSFAVDESERIRLARIHAVPHGLYEWLSVRAADTHDKDKYGKGKAHRLQFTATACRPAGNKRIRCGATHSAARSGRYRYASVTRRLALTLGEHT